MENKGEARHDDRERLVRFLAWRRKAKRVSRAPATAGTPVTKLLSYAAPVAWLGIGVLTVALVTTRMANPRPGRAPVAETPRPTTGPLFAPAPPSSSAQADPRSEFPVRTAAIARVRADAYSRPVWSDSMGRPTPSAASVRRRETAAPVVRASRLTTTVATVRRWVGSMPEVRPDKAIVRWVKSPPPAHGQWPVEPERPEAR
jgi:hypothetical protein